MPYDINGKYYKNVYSYSRLNGSNLRKYSGFQQHSYFPVYEKPKTNVFDYNDPNQVNSMADVIVNAFNKDKNNGNFMGSLFSGTYDLIKRGTINPLHEGDMKAVGINALVNFSETLDIAAAPTKALLQGHGIEGAKKALGIGVDGRQNYDWDANVGNKFTNFLVNSMLELVSDPLNLLSFGTKAAANIATKSLMEPVIAKAAKEASVNVSDKLYKTLSERLVKSYVSKDAAAFAKSADDVAAWMKNNKYIDIEDKTSAVVNLATALKNVRNTAFEKTTTLDVVGMRAANVFIKASKVDDTVQSAMLKAALFPNIMIPYQLCKTTKWGITEFARRYRKTQVIKKYDRGDGCVSIIDINEIVNTYNKNMASVDKSADEIGELPTRLPDDLCDDFERSVRKDTEYLLNVIIAGTADPRKMLQLWDGYIKNTASANKCADWKSYYEATGKILSNAPGTYANIKVLLDKVNETYEAVGKLAVYSERSDAVKVSTKLHQEVQSIISEFIVEAPTRHGVATYFYNDPNFFLYVLDNTDRLKLKHDIPFELFSKFEGYCKQLSVNPTFRALRDYIKFFGKKLDSDDLEAVNTVFDMLDTSKKVFSNYTKSDYNILNGDVIKTNTLQYVTALFKERRAIVAKVRQYARVLKQRSIKQNTVSELYNRYANLLDLFYDDLEKVLPEYIDNVISKGIENSNSALVRVYNRYFGENAPCSNAIEAINNAVAFRDTYDKVCENATSILKEITDEGYGNSSNLVKLQAKLEVRNIGNRLADAPENYRNIISDYTHIMEDFEEVAKLYDSPVAQDIIKTFNELKRLTDLVEETGKLDENLELAKLLHDPASPGRYAHDLNFATDVENARLLREDSAAPLTHTVITGDEVAMWREVANAPKTIEDLLGAASDKVRQYAVELTNKGVDYATIKTIEQMDPCYATRDMLEYNGALSAFTFKLEQLKTTLRTTCTGPIGEFMSDVYSGTNDIGRIINELRNSSDKTLSEPAEVIYEAAQRAHVYKKFVISVSNNYSLPDVTRLTFLETIQNYINTEPIDVITNPTFYDKFIHSVDMGAYSRRNAKRAALDTFRGKLADVTSEHYKWLTGVRFKKDGIDPNSEVGKRVLDTLINGGHQNAESDTMLTQVFCEFYMHDDLEKYANGRPVVFVDLEATDLNPATSTVLQAAVRDSRTSLAEHGKLYKRKWMRYSDMTPMDFPGLGAYETFYGRNKTADEYKQLFLQEYLGDANVGEMTIIEQMLRTIPEGAIVIFHNGDSFDVPLLRSRIRLNGARSKNRAFVKFNRSTYLAKRSNPNNISPDSVMRPITRTKQATSASKILDNLEVYDSFKMYCNKYNVPYVDSISKGTLEDSLYAYCNELIDLGAKKLIPTTSISTMLGSVAGIEDTLAKQINNLPEGTAKEALALQLDEFSEAVRKYKVYAGNIKEDAAEYKTQWYANPFKQPVQEASIADLQKYGVTEGLYHRVLNGEPGAISLATQMRNVGLLSEILGITPAQVRIKYGVQPNVPQILESEFGIHNVYDDALITKYFTISGSSHVVIERRLGNRLYNISKKISTYIDQRIKRVDGMEVCDFDGAFKLFKTLFQDNGVISRINMDNIVRTNEKYAVMRTIWDSEIAPAIAMQHGMSISEYNGLSNNQMLHLIRESFPDLNEPTLIYCSNVGGVSQAMFERYEGWAIEDISSHIFGYASNNKGGLFDSAPAMRMNVARRQLNSHIESMQDFCRSLDSGKNFVSQVFTISTLLQPLAEVVSRVSSFGAAERSLWVKDAQVSYGQAAYAEGVETLQRAITEPDYLLRLLTNDSPYIIFANAGHIVYTRLRDKLFAMKQFYEDKYGLVFHMSDEGLFIGINKDTIIKTDVDGTEGGVKVVANINGHDMDLKALNHNKLIYKANETFTEADAALVNTSFDKLSRIANGKSNGTVGRTVSGLVDSKRIELSYIARLRQRMPAEFISKVYTPNQYADLGLFKGVWYDRIVQGDLQSKTYFTPGRRTNPLVNAWSSLQHQANTTSKVYLYTELYFAKDNGFALSDPTLFGGMSDQQILQTLKQSDEFVVARLAPDNTALGYHVQRLNINHVDDITYAKKADAVLLPYQVYAASFDNINSKQFENGTLRLWQKAIYLYKIGYLADPGTFLRNYVDSTLRSALITGDLFGALGAQMEAIKLINLHKKTSNEILNAYKNSSYGNTARNNYFKHHAKDAPMDKNMFEFLDYFFADGPSTGEAKSLQAQMSTRNRLKNKEINPEPTNNMWAAITHVGDKLLTPSSKIEEVVRLGEYIQLIRSGKTNTQALNIVQKTHFDYSVKSLPTMYAELFIPFYNFTRLNIHFWIDLAQNNPGVMRALGQVMGVVWDFDDLDYYEMSKNRSLQSQMLSGNLEISPQHMTLKINPSYMDVFNTIYDPANMFMTKLWAPLKNSLEYSITKSQAEGSLARNIFNLNDLQNTKDMSNMFSAVFKDTSSYPIAGALAGRYLYAAKTYSERLDGQPNQQLLAHVFPGMFGATQRWEEFKRFPRYARKGNKRYYSRHYSKYTLALFKKYYFIARFGAFYHNQYYPDRNIARLQRDLTKNYYYKLWTKRNKFRKYMGFGNNVRYFGISRIQSYQKFR